MIYKLLECFFSDSKVDSETSNPYITEVHPDGYVLKVTNSLDSKNDKMVAAQNEMMLFLHSNGIRVPKPVRNVTGSYLLLAEIAGDKGMQHVTLLVVFH